MSDPPLSGIYFKNKMIWVWTTLKFHPLMASRCWLAMGIFISFWDAFDFRRFSISVSVFRIIANMVNFKIKIWFSWFLVRSELDDNVKMTKYHESFTINFSANITNIRACSCKKTHKHTNLDHNLVTRWGDKDVSHVDVQVRYVHVQDISMSHRPNFSAVKIMGFQTWIRKNFEFTNTYWHSSEVKWKKRELRELNKLTR